MEGGGEGKVGRKWVGIGWLEGACEGGGACGPYACGFCRAGAGRRPGGAERRRNGRSPFARRDGGRPAARMPAVFAGWGGVGGGAQPLSAEPKAAGGACGDRPEGGRAAP